MISTHLILAIASRFVRTDKSERGVLKAVSRLVFDVEVYCRSRREGPLGVPEGSLVKTIKGVIG